MVTSHAINRPAHRVDHQPARHGFTFHGHIQFARRVERRFIEAVSYDFYGTKKTAAADIADMMMIVKTLMKPPVDLPAPLRLPLCLAIPSCSKACRVPVGPVPHMTSSRIRRTP